MAGKVNIVDEYKSYLKGIRKLLKLVKTREDEANFFTTSMDYTIEFCENHNHSEQLRIEFVAVGMSAVAFHGWARYRAGEITLKQFKEKIIPILNEREGGLKPCQSR